MYVVIYKNIYCFGIFEYSDEAENFINDPKRAHIKPNMRLVGLLSPHQVDVVLPPRLKLVKRRDGSTYFRKGRVK